MTETELYKEILDGGVYDVTKHIPKDTLEEELAELLYTWSVFKDSERFAGAMQRHIKVMCARIADHVENMEKLSKNYAEDQMLEYADHWHDEIKDRKLENMQ